MPGSADNPNSSLWAKAFQEAFEALRWIDGRNVKMEYRWGDNADVQRAHAQELAGLNLDVIFAGAASSLIRLKAATQTTPIVFANVADPVALGFVDSLARPSGNITGFANYEQSVGAKWLELLKQIAPRVSRTLFI